VLVFKLAMVFFIVANPIGNSPTIITLIKNHGVSRQQQILFRESMFALILAIFFLFLGEIFLNSLLIKEYALRISGGTLLFIVALKMIFSREVDSKSDSPKQDPFIVPIATPLISGAGLLTTILLKSNETTTGVVLLGILVAWIGVTVVLVTAPYLQLLLGKRGLAALEQLMGMLLAMIAIQMFIKGMALFLIKSIPA
jgi:multiple antibiotic resistance protein